MAVPVTVGDKTIDAGTPRPLFGVDVVAPVSPYPNDYAVTTDGQRFLVNSSAPEANRQALTALLNGRPILIETEKSENLKRGGVIAWDPPDVKNLEALRHLRGHV